MSRRLQSRLRAARFGAAGFLAVAWLVSAAAPAAAQSRREMQMMADIRMLQEQTQQMQQQLAAAIEQLSANLKAISSRQDEQTAQTRKSFADQKLVIDQFATDLRIVRERIDESNVRITTLSQEVEALRLAIPTFTAPASAAPVDPNATAGAPPPPVDPAAPLATPPPMAPGSPQRMFNTALADFTSGQWSLCIQGFDMYLRSFARTDAADDAQWYIGECHYNDGKFPQAVDAYNRVIANFPRGDRVPDAYYKRGVTYTNMKQPDQARESFETVIKLFPDHEMARLAKQQLTRLQGKPPGE